LPEIATRLGHFIFFVIFCQIVKTGRLEAEGLSQVQLLTGEPTRIVQIRGRKRLVRTGLEQFFRFVEWVIRNEFAGTFLEVNLALKSVVFAGRRGKD